MFFEWLTISFVALIVLLLVSLFLWESKRIRFSSQVIMSALMAFVAFQLLLLVQGSFAYPGPESPLETKVIVAVAIILLFNTIVQLVKWLLIEFFVNYRNFNIPNFVLDIIGLLAMIVVALFVVSNIFNIELTGLLVGSTVVSAVIGLSLQEVLGNLFAGIILQIESPFVIGDWVEVAGQEAQVVKQNWRTLAVLTRHNHHILITNTSVSQDKIVNFSRPTPLQAQDVIMAVPDIHPPNEVKEILRKSVIGIEGVLAEPPIDVHLLGYGDTDISYRVRYWIDDFLRKEDIQDEVLTRFWYALRRANIAQPTPMRDLNVRMIPVDYDEQEQAKQYAQVLALLRELPLLANLDDTQIKNLANISQRLIYTIGELVIRQGEPGDALFVIKSGQALLYSYDHQGQELHIDHLTANDFFGEISLLTGQAHQASVMAKTEIVVIVINKQVFSELLLTDMTILEKMLQTLDQRRDKLAHLQIAARSRTTSQDDLTGPQQTDLIQQVSQFLGLSKNGH